MNYHEELVNALNKLAREDGVITISRVYQRYFDIELRFQDYIYIERFPSDMAREDAKPMRIAAILLSTLFNDYYHAKGKLLS